MRRSVTGFTIVELLVVIVVIAILATISVVTYTGIQARANDAKMKAGVRQFETALSIWVQDHPLPIRGGSGSTLPADNGECSNGSSGFLASTAYTCTVDDALISAGVLPSGFMLSLPKNTYFGGVSTGRYSTMLYSCGGSSSGRYTLFWTLQSPTAEDTASLENALTTCPHNTQIRDTWGMRAAKILQF